MALQACGLWGQSSTSRTLRRKAEPGMGVNAIDVERSASSLQSNGDAVSGYLDRPDNAVSSAGIAILSPLRSA